VIGRVGRRSARGVRLLSVDAAEVAVTATGADGT
jgi:hypothetical protein